MLASLLVTAKQQGQDPLDYLAKVLTARGKLPPLALQRSPPAVDGRTLNIYDSILMRNLLDRGKVTLDVFPCLLCLV